MNERIIKLGLDSGMLNYVDHETPRHYFLSGNADEECLEKFAELIVKECIGIVKDLPEGYKDYRSQIEDAFRDDAISHMKHRFGIE